MRLKTITKLLIDAHNKEIEDKLWQQWLVDYGTHMDKDNFISFEKYKEETFKPKAEKIDAEKVLKDAEEIKAADRGRG
jgi:hypothetical protein